MQKVSQSQIGVYEHLIKQDHTIYSQKELALLISQEFDCECTEIDIEEYDKISQQIYEIY